jgi:Domain of unknown function (DUF4160)
LIFSATAHLRINHGISASQEDGTMMVTRRHRDEVGVPELLRLGPYRFHFHAREHDPPHVHVDSADAKAVYLLSPESLDRNRGYTPRHLKEIRTLVMAHRHEFLRRWDDFFRR